MPKRREENESEILITLNYLSRLDSWLNNNYNRIKKTYSNKWIIIKNFQVIDSDTDLHAIKKRHEGDKKILIEYISENESPMLLNIL
ncbi:MAG: hypothetical protein KAJ51_18025 [Thermoplasmata archaeon]|nr:hypothetical protein [Thermoplasmata archaeon]